MIPRVQKIIFLCLVTTLLGCALTVQAQTVTVDAKKLLPHTEVSLSPRSGSFVEGSTFEMPIFVNSRGKSINGIEVKINFDKDKLSIISPTGGTSVIGVWVEAPVYDNTRGTLSYVGVVPNGITTNAGLVGTVTFKAKTTGKAVVSVSSRSRILLNDGLGTETLVDLGRAEYTILTKAPEGVQVFSDTHAVQDNWYNNNSPVVSWVKDPGVEGFSFSIDNKPATVPDNTIDSADTTKSFKDLNDGLWYFHIKAVKGDVWGTTGHFLLRVDTTPPAEFKPEANYLAAAAVLAERTLVSFFTTDNLSGVDHYEVGIIDKNQPPTESPVFVQSESPFQVPLHVGSKLQVVVRAVDHAGNVRDESIDIRTPGGLDNFVTNHLVAVLSSIILLGSGLLVSHYLFGHHLIQHAQRMFQMIRKEEAEEIIKEVNSVVNNSVGDPPEPPK